MIARVRPARCTRRTASTSSSCSAGSERELARAITALEAGAADDALRRGDRATPPRGATVPVLGITGTGGSGKSSLTDELLRRFRLDQADKLRIAVIAVDPTRRRGGGALLGDRIRMNAIDSPTDLLPFAGHARRPAAEVPGCARPGHRRRQGVGCRSGHRRDAGHRPGRRGDRAATSTCRCT